MANKARLFTFVYGLSGLLTGFLLSWILLAQVDFLYGFWHDRVGIAEGIETYGPQNRYRQGFADTTREERVRVFAEINRAIHNDGEGLADIYYDSSSQTQPQQLLREPEIGHLQDVARLVTLLQWVGIAVALVWLGCLAWALVRDRELPRLKHQLIGIGGALAVITIVVVLIGPERVFNQLHIWIFPPDHPWFFYYQDSLMSTLMLAPRLFGWITLVWVPLAVVCFLLLHVMAVLTLRWWGRPKSDL